MWKRNKNETNVLHECVRCKAFTMAAVGHTCTCGKCGLMLAVDSGIAKDNEKASKVQHACSDPHKYALRNNTLIGRSLAHARNRGD
jgi:ribosomal protein S27AE